jgi:AraC family transcriptional regulator, ethanolamine operon transcriptional activator
MAVFTDGVAAVQSFNDFDAMAAALPAWKLEFARLGSGDFSARLEVAMTAELQITRFTLNSALLAIGDTPHDASGAALIMSAPYGVRSRGREIDTATTAPAHAHGGDVHFLTAGAVDMVVVIADQALFGRHLHGRFGREGMALGSDWLIHTPPGTADCVERGRAVVSLLSVLSSRAGASHESRHRLQECVLQILLDGLETDAASSRVAPSPVRRRVARAAEEVLRARLDDPPSLRELCEVLGVPERTLHHAFHEGFGMAPKAYFRALRLSAAHGRLRRGKGPVTEVAADLGLFHFGRFSAEYRAMFGEPPSETLRRA